MRFKLIFLIITIFPTLSIVNTFSQSNLILNKLEEELPKKNYFDLSNETITILDSVIYDFLLNYTAFVFSNVTDSGLIILFGSENTTLQSNESFLGEKIFDHLVIFKLHSRGNSTGYYWIGWNYCCYITPPDNESGKLSNLNILDITIPISVISIITRRNKSIK